MFTFDPVGARKSLQFGGGGRGGGGGMRTGGGVKTKQNKKPKIAVPVYKGGEGLDREGGSESDFLAWG